MPPGRNRGSGCVFAGIIAGENAVKVAVEAQVLKISDEQVAVNETRAFEPLH